MLTNWSATEIADRVARRDVSVREVVEAHLARIEQVDPKVGAFLTVDRDQAMAWADAAQLRVDDGDAGPLAGVPVALKDNLSTAGLRTTCASKILADYVPVFDAHVVERLRAEGLCVLGKTNLDEFAFGTSTETSAFQLTRNPWDLERSPGGSSGGSAAAVAGRLAPLALGSDTGGSIRQPASLCGVVGFKPTYGRVSRYGLIAFGSSLDQIGPFGRTVEDVARMAHVISGHDRREATSRSVPPIEYRHVRQGSLRGLRLAIPQEMVGDAIQPGVREVFSEALDTLRREGVETVEVSIPSVKIGVTTYYIIAPAEASSNLARFDGVRYGLRVDGHGHVGAVESSRGQGFGHEVKSRIMIGTYALSAGYYDAYYLRAQQVRALMARQIEDILKDVDAILSPTSPVTAFKIGELSDDPLALKLLDLCTIPANLGGNPAISLNCGFHSGLPVGLQLMGPQMGDEALLQLAFCVESALSVATPFPEIA